MFKNRMRSVHPGEILLEDYIKPTSMSVRALSLALNVPYSRMREIVDGKRRISADTALRLERYFGSEAQGWLNLQATYDLRVAKKLCAKTISRDITPLAIQARDCWTEKFKT
jgi:addiction module HigA family antidote